MRKVWRKLVGFRYPTHIQRDVAALSFSTWIDKPISYRDGSFSFVNITVSSPSFSQKCDSALWRYNLNYMDYLLQPGMSKDEGIRLVEWFIKSSADNPIANDPYPVALRSINWIKFFYLHQVENAGYNAFLYAQYQVLTDNLEYHLLGNHLLEDGFSLLFGGFYFKDELLYLKGKTIVESELKEQILDDGAHFELSPMYHQILLDRLLDCINLVSHNQVFDTQQELLDFMRGKASSMLTWLDEMTFKNGAIPLFNDAAVSIAPTTKVLCAYADRIGVELPKTYYSLGSSGYRKFSNENYECIIDIGQIGPRYQPGHAHADTFGFVMHVKGRPLFEDWGVSTYNASPERIREKSTASHNTVTVLDENSSQVWSSFRVGQRARVKVLKDTPNHVTALHDGYRRFKTKHQREWRFEENEVFIKDELFGKETMGKAHFWLDVEDAPVVKNDLVMLKDAVLSFVNPIEVRLRCEKMPRDYNLLVDTYKIEVLFKFNLETHIIILN